MNVQLQHMFLGYERLLEANVQKGCLTSEADLPKGFDTPCDSCLAFDSS